LQISNLPLNSLDRSKMKTTIYRQKIPITGLFTGLLLLVSGPIWAGTIYSSDSFSADANIEIAGGALAGSEDYSTNNRGNVTWGESYFKFGLGGRYSPPSHNFEIYGAASAMHTATYGDGDLAGFSDGSESLVDLEDAYLGIKHRFQNRISVDFSVGAQRFQIGDGFLIYNELLSLGVGAGRDANRGGAYWLAGRKAFRKTAILKLDFPTPYRMDAFYLGSENPGNGDLEIAGINIERISDDFGTLGITYFRGLKVDKNVLSGSLQKREGMDTYSIRANGTPVKNIFLSGEFAFQKNNGQGSTDVSAHAWYTEVGYTFVKQPFSPKLTYRYSFFSGNDPNTGTNEAFDPLFYSNSRGFGTWYQGEIAGNYSGPFSTNTGIHHASMALQINDKMSFNLLYFKFATDEPSANVSDDFGQELDLIFEWSPNDNFYVTPGYAMFIPGAGGKSTLASVKTSHLFQLGIIYMY